MLAESHCATHTWLAPSHPTEPRPPAPGESTGLASERSLGEGTEREESSSTEQMPRSVAVSSRVAGEQWHHCAMCELVPVGGNSLLVLSSLSIVCCAPPPLLSSPLRSPRCGFESAERTQSSSCAPHDVQHSPTRDNGRFVLNAACATRFHCGTVGPHDAAASLRIAELSRSPNDVVARGQRTNEPSHAGPSRIAVQHGRGERSETSATMSHCSRPDAAADCELSLTHSVARALSAVPSLSSPCHTNTASSLTSECSPTVLWRSSSRSRCMLSVSPPLLR